MADIFREDQPITPLPLALLVGMALLEIYLSFGVHDLPRIARIVQWVAAGLFLLAALVLRRLTIRLTSDFFIFGFGPFKKRVRRSQITSVRIVEASLVRTGIGIHRTAGGIWAWVARPGPAIEILLTNSPVTGYIVSTGRPRDLKALLLGDHPELRAVGNDRTL